MKHLKTRQDFLTGIVEYKETYQVAKSDYKDSALIREVFENDITWGGSLLGRLINSTIRKAAIGAKTLRVNPLLKKLKAELESLEGEYLNKEMEIEYLRATVYAIIEAIKKAAEAGEPLDVFLGDGSKDSGLINQAIVRLNKVEDFPDKADLIKALENFRNDLNALKGTGVKEEITDEDIEEMEETPVETGSVKETFVKSTIKILESIINIVSKISSTSGQEQKVETTPEEKKFKVGGVYTFTNDKKEKKKVKLISFSHQVNVGPDTNYLTKDDIKKATLAKPELVYVEFLNPDGTEMKNKPAMAVNVDQLSIEGGAESEDVEVSSKVTAEGFIFESFEDPKANVAYKNILKYYKSSNIKTYIKPLQEIVNGFKTKQEANKFEWSGIVWPTEADLESKIIQFGKQIAANLKTVGKPLSETEIISESVQFNDATKSVSLFCRSILGLKNQKDLISKIPNISEDINAVIDSYDVLVENSEKLKQKSEETKPKEAQKPEGEKTTQEKHLMSYSNFRKIFEADEPEGEDQKSDNKTENKVLVAYKKNFSPDDEKKWILGKQEKLETSTRFKNANINIDTDKNADPIVKIADIFGDAYRLFSTPQIPSGRPNGRISQRTWREYKYLGKGTGDWTAERAPNGPFAVKAIYNKWEKGVMTIIQDQALRKIFANPNLSINGNAGAGQTLFKFINDMIQDEALSDYDGARRNLLLKYFNIEDAKIQPAKPTVEGKTVSNDDKGEKGSTVFMQQSFSLNATSFSIFERGYFILEYTEEKVKKYLLMFILGKRKDKEGKPILIFKYQIGGIDLLDYIKSFDKKLPEDDVVKNLKPGKNLYLGFCKFPTSKKFNFEGIEMTKFFAGEKPEQKNIEITNSWALFETNDKSKQVAVKLPEGIKDEFRPKGDRSAGADKIEALYRK